MKPMEMEKENSPQIVYFKDNQVDIKYDDISEINLLSKSERYYKK